MQETEYRSASKVSGHVAALARSHMNGVKPFERTIEQTTETMFPQVTFVHFYYILPLGKNFTFND